MSRSAVLFDKDGTLIDLHATWGIALGIAIEDAAHSPAAIDAACELLHYDRIARRFAMTSPFVAESVATINALVESHIDITRFGHKLTEAGIASVEPAPGAEQLLAELAEHDVPMAVVTNDEEHTARFQMQALGWSRYFVAILGADSGHGAKPDPGMVLHACSEAGADPSSAWMVGDSSHDLLAGRAATCRTLLVSNGNPPADELSTLADLTVETLRNVCAKGSHPWGAYL